MIVVEFPPPCALMSLNDRGHWRTRHVLTKAWRTAAWAAACTNRHQRTQPPSTITVHLPVRDNRRRDPHNYFATVKPCIDGLVDAGLFPDDTPEWVTTTEPRLVVGAKTVRIEAVPR